MRTILTAILLVSWGLGANAQAALQSFEVPDHCEGFMTVQFRSCSVTHYYTCDGLADQIIGVSSDGEGGLYLQRYDDEFRTLEHRDPGNGLFFELQMPEKDPLSLSELLEDGYDTFEYVDLLNGSTELTVKGFDRLTDIEIEIDGRLMKMTEFEFRMRTPDGEVINHQSGQQFIDPEHPMLHPGIFVDHLDAENTINHTPVDFIYPGETGFGSRLPAYDCEANL